MYLNHIARRQWKMVSKNLTEMSILWTFERSILLPLPHPLPDKHDSKPYQSIPA
ncbi:MAG: hypothetical protein LBH04_01125 [Tannerellaceae bacterium]|nr:hypothetical protein [Tannerellaceae bacterium]